MGQQDEATTAASEVEQLRQRVAELEARSTRRNMLRLAGAAVVGGVAASVAGAQPAAATTGAMQYGTGNNAGNAATTLTSTLAGAALVVDNPEGSGNSYGVRGQAHDSGTGVHGKVVLPTSLGYGVLGEADGTVGFGLVGIGGAAQIYVFPNAGGFPTTGLHREGELRANDKALYYCVLGDQSGVGTWRTVADISSAGVFFPITPARVYDSRKPAPLQGVLATGANRLVSCADMRDVTTGAVTQADVVPSGARAVAFNVTVVNTVGSNGFLAVNPGGNTTVSASTINWSAPSLTLANASVVAVNANRAITVICGGTNTSCNFIIDVLGYYL